MAWWQCLANCTRVDEDRIEMLVNSIWACWVLAWVIALKILVSRISYLWSIVEHTRVLEHDGRISVCTFYWALAQYYGMSLSSSCISASPMRVSAHCLQLVQNFEGMNSWIDQILLSQDWSSVGRVSFLVCRTYPVSRLLRHQQVPALPSPVCCMSLDVWWRKLVLG